MVKCAVDESVIHLAEMLKVISDVNRLRILCLLFDGEKCVCDIEEGLGISQPLASHHLNVLKEAGLVKVRRAGTWSYYSLVGEVFKKLNDDFNRFLGSQRLLDRYPMREVCDPKKQ
jgi:ArsR family transcriptional regulator